MLIPAGQWFIDTSILLRLDQPGSPARPAVIETLKKLTAAVDPQHFAPQNLADWLNGVPGRRRHVQLMLSEW